MGKLAPWYKALLAKLNIHADNSLTLKESEYRESGDIKDEKYLIVELGAYTHGLIESLRHETMGDVFDYLGQKVEVEFRFRPDLREVYLLADDPHKVPINKSRRTAETTQTPKKVKTLTQAEESFTVARLKRLLTMPMPAGKKDQIRDNLSQISLGRKDVDREALVSTPTTRFLLEIGLARIWLYHMCSEAILAKKKDDLMVYLEGVGCLSSSQLQVLIKSDFLPSKIADVSRMPGLRDRRRMLAGDLSNTDISLDTMAAVHSEAGIDYPGESDHKIFPITTNPVTIPGTTLPCYGIVTSDFDIVVFLLTNLPRLVVTEECPKDKQCTSCKTGGKCRFKNTIPRNIVVHMTTSYKSTKKGKNGEEVEAEEPRRVFKIVPLYRAIHNGLRTKDEFKWMDYPLDTFTFLTLLCATKTDFCDGLPDLGPAAVFDGLAEVSTSKDRIAKYKDMVGVNPFTYIGMANSIVCPMVNLDKIRSFIIGLYTKKNQKILSDSRIVVDATTRQFTLDQIHTVDLGRSKLEGASKTVRIKTVNEKRFKVVLDNAIWNLNYVFNGFIAATVYRSNCVELDASGNPKYSWKNTGTMEALGASHHINSAFITNDF